MEILFLGTSAAEQAPAIFCRCDFCREVRRTGGRDLRTRSSLRIGDRYQIDFGPDANWQMHRCEVDLFDLEHLFITHTHNDHFQFEEIGSKSLAAVTNEKPLHIYLSRPAKEYLEGIYDLYEAQFEEEGTREAFQRKYPVHGLEYFRRYAIGDLVVETVKGNHLAEGKEQFSLNYLMRLPDGRRLLYAVDTGYYPEDSWGFLRGRQAEILIMDCTFWDAGGQEPDSLRHHTRESFLATLARMREIGFLTERSRVFATHFNPHEQRFHDQIQAFFDQSGFAVTAAYDGLRI